MPEPQPRIGPFGDLAGLYVTSAEATEEERWRSSCLVLGKKILGGTEGNSRHSYLLVSAFLKN